mgnify:CR=1 FL=1
MPDRILCSSLNALVWTSCCRCAVASFSRLLGLVALISPIELRLRDDLKGIVCGAGFRDLVFIAFAFVSIGRVGVGRALQRVRADLSLVFYLNRGLGNWRGVWLRSLGRWLAAGGVLVGRCQIGSGIFSEVG